MPITEREDSLIRENLVLVAENERLRAELDAALAYLANPMSFDMDALKARFLAAMEGFKS